MPDYALYILSFICGALVAWIVGYVEARLGPTHHAAVGAARKAIREPLAELHGRHEVATAMTDERLKNIEAAIYGK